MAVDLTFHRHCSRRVLEAGDIVGREGEGEGEGYIVSMIGIANIHSPASVDSSPMIRRHAEYRAFWVEVMEDVHMEEVRSLTRKLKRSASLFEHSIRVWGGGRAGFRVVPAVPAGSAPPDDSGGTD